MRDATAAGSAPKYIAYLRVSTDRQGHSGLGLEAQHEAVETYVARNDGVIVAEFVEIESGKKNSRPKLASALAECRRLKAKLIIAKLDRLARSVHFISGMMEAGVDFVAVDNPHANRLMLHLLAAFAEHEREMISQRTKAALAAAKARGVQLGANGKVLARQNRIAADRRAADLAPLITEIGTRGVFSARGVAEELNIANIRSANGGMWSATTVQRLLRGIEYSPFCNGK